MTIPRPWTLPEYLLWLGERQKGIKSLSLGICIIASSTSVITTVQQEEIYLLSLVELEQVPRMAKNKRWSSWAYTLKNLQQINCYRQTLQIGIPKTTIGSVLHEP